VNVFCSSSILKKLYISKSLPIAESIRSLTGIAYLRRFFYNSMSM